jgi:serpin B
MTIFLPKSDFEVNGLISVLESDDIGLWLENFSDQNGTVQFPKYQLEYQIQLKDVLSSMGMGEAFNPNLADFSKLYQGTQKAYLTSVLHKTFVEVNEEGTEAAAVTSVTVGITSVGSGFHFKVNKPYFFFIRENQSNTILFAGKIVEPKTN